MIYCYLVCIYMPIVHIMEKVFKSSCDIIEEPPRSILLILRKPILCQRVWKSISIIRSAYKKCYDPYIYVLKVKFRNSGPCQLNLAHMIYK